MLGFLATPPEIHQPVIIQEDRGGLVDLYERTVIRYNLENRRVEIRGSCHSACTLALGVKNVCVGKGAKIRWHHAYNSFTGETRADVTRRMLSEIPFKIAQTVEPYISVSYNDKATLNYTQLVQLGVPDCDGYNPTVQANVTTGPSTPKATEAIPQQMLGPGWNKSAATQAVPYPTTTNSTTTATSEIDLTEQKKQEFEVAYGDALTISTKQNGAPATLRNCDSRRCEDIAAYYDRKGQYVELHKSLNSDNRVICRLSRAGLFEDDYSCTNWLTGQKLAYHWSRDPIY
jgi:hypothetical protein